ncbi:MAG: histidine kinase, partial [Spirochaetes bacterium]
PFTPPLIYLLIWVGLSLLILLFISRAVAITLLNPINRLRESMKEVEEGNFDISVKVSDYAEIAALAKDFNIMIRKIGDLIDLNEEEHRKLRISDFNALQSQINPHFLYNTLDSVIWMSAKRQSDDVITMVSSLSKLLRRSLATGDSLVPLEEEYDHAKQYCIIQKIRYKDQLDFSLNLPEDCRKIGVPRLILQPLIENALYHGIEDWEDGAQIRISAERFTESLKITVSDNGKGADPAELEAILSVQVETRPNSSVGLKNINDRLKILFGEAGSMSFFHQVQGGLDVIITIPI